MNQYWKQKALQLGKKGFQSGVKGLTFIGKQGLSAGMYAGRQGYNYLNNNITKQNLKTFGNNVWNSRPTVYVRQQLSNKPLERLYNKGTSIKNNIKQLIQQNRDKINALKDAVKSSQSYLSNKLTRRIAKPNDFIQTDIPLALKNPNSRVNRRINRAVQARMRQKRKRQKLKSQIKKKRGQKYAKRMAKQWPGA